MSATGFLCLSRTSASTTAVRRSSRGYCWSKCYRWSYGTYPRSLKHLESCGRPFNPSDAGQLHHGRVSKDPGTFNHAHLPYRGWRLSSSWGRWNSGWHKSDRKQQATDKDSGEGPAAWSPLIERFEKDSAALCELMKKQIDADPFGALFGRGVLYPTRPFGWGTGNRHQGSEENKQLAGLKKSDKPLDMDKIRREHEHHAHVSNNESMGAQTTSTIPASTSAERGALVQDYEIDPITMRKKLIPSPTDQSSGTPVQKIIADEAVDIPVKRFQGVLPQKPSDKLAEKDEAPKPNSAGPRDPGRSSRVAQSTNSSDWLAQEGFAPKKQNVPTPQANNGENALRPTSKLESAVNRRMRLQTSRTGSSDVRSGLSYDAKENTAEDVDLLRASDVRASSGLGSGTRRESALQRHLRRQKLEEQFDLLSREMSDIELLRDLEHLRMKRQRAAISKRQEVRRAHLEKEISAQKAAMEAMEMRQARAPTSSEETPASQPEQGEGDMARNVHEFASRERWYKRKAPHAAGLEEQEAIQSAKDRSFVREIRGIYEDTYGVIDTKHRQPATAASSTGEPKSDMNQNPVPPAKPGEDLDGKRKKDKLLPSLKGPLSAQEKIGTMLQQLSDDSRSLQKILRTCELSRQVREELFHRNRSMRNASDAITEALSTSPSIPRGEALNQAVQPKSQRAVSDTQEQSKPVPPAPDTKKPSTVYSVLAYDPSIQQVTTAEMSSPSESPSERRLSLSEALSTLTDPAKFLPHLTTLQSQGYEIVSATPISLSSGRPTKHSHQPLLCPQQQYRTPCQKTKQVGGPQQRRLVISHHPQAL